jgi:hypothetical protein
MDGGRALRALLAERMGTYRATEIAAKIGKAVALVMGVVGVVWGPFMLALVAAFVWFAANGEQQASRAEAQLGGHAWNGPRRSTWSGTWASSPTSHDRGRDLRGPESWEARRVYEAMRPVRVVLVRRGGFF